MQAACSDLLSKPENQFQAVESIAKMDLCCELGLEEEIAGYCESIRSSMRGNSILLWGWKSHQTGAAQV